MLVPPAPATAGVAAAAVVSAVADAIEVVAPAAAAIAREAALPLIRACCHGIVTAAAATMAATNCGCILLIQATAECITATDAEREDVVHDDVLCSF